ncbi:unnamed protein product [Mytilus coruscus]|uniref:Uncharacterized protein n=1 Tax=Mytilus coruscus TaxID=42192 RepID=A0A6J8CWU4_MYTCO|nr:unnamed protein product [Mytilus coruscus]
MPGDDHLINIHVGDHLINITAADHQIGIHLSSIPIDKQPPPPSQRSYSPQGQRSASPGTNSRNPGYFRQRSPSPGYRANQSATPTTESLNSNGWKGNSCPVTILNDGNRHIRLKKGTCIGYIKEFDDIVGTADENPISDIRRGIEETLDKGAPVPPQSSDELPNMPPHLTDLYQRSIEHLGSK